MSQLNAFGTAAQSADGPLDSLDAVLESTRATFAKSDLELTCTLVNRFVLELWFGLPADEYLHILRAINTSGQPLGTVAQAILQFIELSSQATPSGQSEDEASEEANGPDSSERRSDQARVSELLKLLELRMSGRPSEALEHTRVSFASQRQVQMLFTAGSAVDLLGSLQFGLTAMLAGDLLLAVSSLTEAKLHPLVNTMPFLTRDALLKSALLHACLGDPVVAHAELELAERVPRTSAWIEPVIDTQAQLVRALTEVESPELAIELIDAIPLSLIGEMWPYYAYAIWLVFERADQASEAARRLRTLDDTRLPRVDGQGLSGSVLPGLIALSELPNLDPSAAFELWQRMDASIDVSRVTEAYIALVTGDASKCKRIAMELRASTRDLRQLEIWRLSLLASSLFALGDQTGCLEALNAATSLPRGLTAREVSVFDSRISEFASQHVTNWPSPERHIPWKLQIPLSAQQSSLTTRETEVLDGLHRGLTRGEIAKELFLTVNTVKTHQQSLYRKLGVSSRDAAVIAGEQRGLL